MTTGATALARLQASRLHLRQAMLPASRTADAAPGNAARGPRRWRALWRCWRQRLRQSPVASLAMAAVQTWWWQQPWREPGLAVAAELRGAVGPVVRRHPVATVLLAGAAGAALVACRPWRWTVLTHRLRPMPGQLGHWLLAQLSQPAVQSMLGALLLSVLGRAATTHAAPPAGTAPAGTATPDGPNITPNHHR